MLHIVVAFLASVIGAICGIGGGVIIKPVLDMLSNDGASTINFMSGCTVLAMSLYSVGKELVSKKSTFDYKTLVPLSIGAAIGGILGNQLFQTIKFLFGNENIISSIQAIGLGIVVLGSLIYTLRKDKIHTIVVKNTVGIFVIGLLLGTMSSFLGIGGGPINIVVLYYFFSYNTKQAAIASIFVILFGQLSNLGISFLTNKIPSFDTTSLLLMIVGGIFGGIVGRKMNSKIQEETVDKLFIMIMCVIICICIFNVFKYLA